MADFSCNHQLVAYFLQFDGRFFLQSEAATGVNARTSFLLGWRKSPKKWVCVAGGVRVRNARVLFSLLQDVSIVLIRLEQQKKMQRVFYQQFYTLLMQPKKVLKLLFRLVQYCPVNCEQYKFNLPLFHHAIGITTFVQVASIACKNEFCKGPLTHSNENAVIEASSNFSWSSTTFSMKRWWRQFKSILFFLKKLRKVFFIEKFVASSKFSCMTTKNSMKLRWNIDEAYRRHFRCSV